MESGSEQRSPRLLPFEAKSQLASPRPVINKIVFSMRFSKARSQLLISLGEPIADPFKSEKLHSGAGAELVGTVVADLYDVAGFVTA